MFLASSCQTDEDQLQGNGPQSVLANNPDVKFEAFLDELEAEGAKIQYDENGELIVIAPSYVGSEKYIREQDLEIIEELGLSSKTAKQSGLGLERWLAEQDDCGGHTERMHFDIQYPSLQSRVINDPTTNVATSFWFFGKTSLSRPTILSAIKWGYDHMKSKNMRQWSFIPNQVHNNKMQLGGGYDGNNGKGKAMTNVKHLNLNIATVGNQGKCFLQTAFPSDKSNKRREAFFPRRDEL